MPSSLYHDRLLYDLDFDGVLYVSDAVKGGLIYMKELGAGKEYDYDNHHHLFGRVHASLVMAGRHIYVFGLFGVTIVFEPGRAYKEVARNKIEDETCALGGRITSPVKRIPEHFGSSPVAEGGRLYVRGSSYMYCIGQKE